MNYFLQLRATASHQSHLLSGLHTANYSWQTQVSDMCERHKKQSAHNLVNFWQQIELASILANYFANFFALVNSNLTCERLANMCW